jgi:B12-binding domain/radical SAM domain protein of rhizo-twelve system
MKVALVNPSWRFDKSIYFGCREPHLPLELGYSAALLARAGHVATIWDGLMDGLDNGALAAAVARFAPDMTVVTTAPTYLFWRCAQPELRIPRAFLDALAGRGGITVAVGPHGSATPVACLRKLGVDVVIRGECEEVVARLAERPDLRSLPGLCFMAAGRTVVTGEPQIADFSHLPALRWPGRWIRGHHHHHHRYGTESVGPGAEVEASRGCPYHCSFCAKTDFRDGYRQRGISALLDEIDTLIAQGTRYVYFVDEIFLPRRNLLEALLTRPVEFGIQTRIDLWKPEMLDLLGKAGCVSIEAGVESLTESGRAVLDKNCRMSTGELTERLTYARRSVPFVQANLIRSATDDAGLVAEWREQLRLAGVWANDPVPLYPYPSSPDYRKLFGEPDQHAWERAHDYYLGQFDRLSDIQEEQPLPLRELETACHG